MSKSQKFVSNLLHHFLTRRIPKVKVQKNTFKVISEEAMSIYRDEVDDNALFSSNNEHVISYMREQLASIKAGGQATIKIDGCTYVFNRYPNSVGISVTRYKKIDVSNLNADYTNPITHDPVVFEKMFLRIAADIPRDSFVLNKSKTDSFKSIILSDDQAEYCDPAFLDLCEQFPEAFPVSQLEEIRDFRKHEFNNLHVKEYNKDLNAMFKNWSDFLVAVSATVDTPYVFNDLDNNAYLDENNSYKMMVQKSQNTVYVYILEKSTNRIKVWNSCKVYPACEFDFDYYVNAKKSYFEAVSDIMNPYSYDVYYANLDHLDSYIKTPSYYLNHFDIDFGLIYDTDRGYRINSAHAQNLMSDFTLLNDSLEYYKDDA